MFRVTMTFAGKPVKKFTFDKPLIAIGRDATCDIVVDNIGASRRHATIERTSDGYVLADLKSHNGTFVGGQKVFHHQLKDTDEFFIGKYAFCFEALEPVTAGGEPEPPPSLPAAAEMTFRLDRKDIERLIGTSQRGAAPQIVQVAPEGERQSVRLDRMYVMLGSDPAAEIRVRGLFPPKKAAIVIKSELGFRLIAISSRVRVNGHTVSDTPLADGDLVTIGRRRWRFCQA
jgi:FHA domain-containing protein